MATKQRIELTCESCGRLTKAPIGTQRLARKLCQECFGKGQDRRPRELNELTGAEWAKASKSVESYPDTRSEKQRLHGACFPKSLALHQISIFTKRDELVLDPFVGVGTTLDAVCQLGRRGIGIELNDEFASKAQKDLVVSGCTLERARIIVDDARNMELHVASNSVNFILTSPPYSNLLKNISGSFAYKWREHSNIDPVTNPRPYSSKGEDLSNMNYEDYLSCIEEVFVSSYRVLHDRSYAVWVVKDFRNLKEGIAYVNLHGDIIKCAESAGFTLWDIRVYDQTRFRPLVCLGYPSRNFYLNIGHSYLLTFKKDEKSNGTQNNEATYFPVREYEQCLRNRLNTSRDRPR
jgi:DNA modification methylase